jgi:hypothetical protein
MMIPADDIRVGDLVNVPGGMYGTVRYLGNVDGKPGRFAGIELAAEHASKGKNSGDVDGRTYFNPSVSGAGIFVPMNASKYVTKRTAMTPPTPSRPSIINFSKSVGPGPPAAPRPRLRRPSLPRSESPRTAQPSKPTLNGLGLRTPSSTMRAINGVPRSPLKTPSRMSERPSSRVSLEEDPPTPATIQEHRMPGGPETQERKEKVRMLEAELRDRDKQLGEQAATLAELQKSITELEGMDALSVRAQLREKNEKIAQLTAEFDSHRADFRSTLDTLEVAASETERVYERRLDELMQQNRELQDRGEDVEIVATQLKQLEELVSELEEGLEDARRGEAEARGEVEFLRGEVERARLELKQEREKSAAALKEVEMRRNTRELEQKDDEIRGLKAIIHSLSRGDSNTTMLRQNGVPSPPGKSDSDGRDPPERITHLEQRIKELEGLAERRHHHIEELQRELDQNHHPNGAGRRPGRSGTVAIQPLRQLKLSRSSIGGGGGKANGKNPVSHVHSLSDRTIVPSDWQEPLGDHALTDDSHETTYSGRDSENQSSDEGTALWCDMCEMSGHDLLSCSNMFGNGAGTTDMDTNGTAVLDGHANGMDPYHHAPSNNRDSAPTRPSNGLKPYGGSPGSQRTGRDVVLEGLKGIGGLASSMSPMAGKTSGVIDESKWCALCERDGHDSIDCPFED